MKVIKRIFRFISILALTLILMLVVLLMCIFIPQSIEYSKYKETGVMKNGSLCISHMCEGAEGWSEKYYNSNDSVLEEADEFVVSRSIGSAVGTVFGKVYKPINSGTSDIYVGYATFGGDPIKYFELYHVDVDKDLNINYSLEIINKESFEQNIKNHKGD